LHRSDEDDFPKEVGGVYVHVDVTNTVFHGIPEVQIVLSPEEAKAVAEQLLIQSPDSHPSATTRGTSQLDPLRPRTCSRDFQKLLARSADTPSQL
jgi:hypothetical protein